MRTPAVNKKYMIIAVSVLIAEFTARNNGGAARQESNPHIGIEIKQGKNVMGKA